MEQRGDGDGAAGEGMRVREIDGDEARGNESETEQDGIE